MTLKRTWVGWGMCWHEGLVFLAEMGWLEGQFLVTGSRDGAVMRALASHHCGPGSILDLASLVGWFVVGTRPCFERFSPVL